MNKYIITSIRETVMLLNTILEDTAFHSRLEMAAMACVNCLKNNGKIILAGNGGSAADAQHIAAEFVSRFSFDRPGLSALAITTDTSIITAIGNDYGYENVFSRQLLTHGSCGDVFIAYSTSGRSPNIVKSLEAARSLGLTTIGFTGISGGSMTGLCDYLINIPSSKTPRIQEAHAALGHILCGLVEEEIYGSSS